MSADIVGLQQITITFIFLGVLVGVLIFLKRKGSFIRANLHGDRHIKMVEETAISPTEKLRLLSIDGQKFIMASSKGVQPVLSPLYSGPSHGSEQNSETFHQKNSSNFEDQFATNTGIASRPDDIDSGKMLPPLELTRTAPTSTKQTERVDEEDVKAFQEKFKSWRQR